MYDLLNIDLKSLLPYVIDAFSSVYGEEYRPIISKKLNKAVIVFYYDIEGLQEYILYLKRCKRRELSICFLDKIGVDVKLYKKDNYTESLNNNIKKILECFVDSDFNLTDNSDRLKIIDKTNEFNTIYQVLLSEYNNWLKKIEPYEKYIEDEKKRRKEILEKKKIELFREIFDQLPLPVKKIISNKTLDEQVKIILGPTDIYAKTIIESFFGYEQIKKLESSNVDFWVKSWIVSCQSCYLKKLGINIFNDNMIECNSEEDIIKYLSFISKEDIKKYIPKDELISYISSTREKKYTEAIKEYYTTRKDFINAMKLVPNNKNNLEYIYEQIRSKKVFIEGNVAPIINNEFLSIMFYTIRESAGGNLFYSFTHECGHIIDQNQKRCGFELFDDYNEYIKKNPYDNAFRKYEKFNETLNDIFTKEAIDFLHNKGIYLIESKEFTILDNSNYNTASITKELLQPIVKKFRQQVIKAKINSEPYELIKYIGKNNFEELVDTVNKVDYLSRNGVASKINKFSDDSMVKEYFEQIERVKRIYINIDNYYANNFEKIAISELEAPKEFGEEMSKTYKLENKVN